MVKRVKGFKGQFTDVDLNNYLTGRFKDEVVNFNTRCGKGVDTFTTVDEALRACIDQGMRVLEESNETVKGYLTKDKKERLDGLVDTLVTNTMLHEMYNKLDKFKEELGEEEYNNQIHQTLSDMSPDSIIVLDVLQSSFENALKLGEGVGVFTPKGIYLACELILANNNEKYTDDKTVADDWEQHLEDGHFIKAVEVEGKTWYSICRKSDNKICKSYNFEEVKLDLG